jgi:hypothetical protein
LRRIDKLNARRRGEATADSVGIAGIMLVYFITINRLLSGSGNLLGNSALVVLLGEALVTQELGVHLIYIKDLLQNWINLSVCRNP